MENPMGWNIQKEERDLTWNYNLLSRKTVVVFLQKKPTKFCQNSSGKKPKHFGKKSKQPMLVVLPIKSHWYVIQSA